LSYNELDDDCIESLGQFIKNSQTIKIINIGKNKITDNGIEILHPYLIGNISFRCLSIHNNKGITDKSIPFLKEIIYKSNIKDLYIGSTSVTNENIFVIPLIENKLKNGSDKIDMNGK